MKPADAATAPSKKRHSPTQAAISRALRAAKAAGGYAVVVRPDGSVAIELVGNDTEPLDSSDRKREIVL